MSIIEKSNQVEAPNNIAIPEVLIKDSATFTTELVKLPSKGLLYDKEDPLHLGTVEMKYMTTKEEDILSNRSYISSGVVLDKLFQSMLITKFNYDNLLLGDRNAIMISAAIYGYGATYNTHVIRENGTKQPVSVDLSAIKHKEIDESLIVPGTNRFKFELPLSKDVVEFQLLTVGLQRQIEQSLANERKYGGKEEKNLTTRLRYMICAINGSEDKGKISKLIDNMRVTDSRALREFIGKVQPDVNLEIEVIDEETGQPFRAEITLGLDLFWPDYKG